MVKYPGCAGSPSSTAIIAPGGKVSATRHSMVAGSCSTHAGGASAVPALDTPITIGRNTRREMIFRIADVYHLAPSSGPLPSSPRRRGPSRDLVVDRFLKALT